MYKYLLFFLIGILIYNYSNNKDSFSIGFPTYSDDFKDIIKKNMKKKVNIKSKVIKIGLGAEIYYFFQNGLKDIEKDDYLRDYPEQIYTNRGQSKPAAELILIENINKYYKALESFDSELLRISKSSDFFPLITKKYQYINNPEYIEFINMLLVFLEWTEPHRRNFIKYMTYNFCINYYIINEEFEIMKEECIKIIEKINFEDPIYDDKSEDV